MSRHRAPQRHPWPVKPTRAQRARAVIARIQGPLPGALLPWLAMLGYCGNNIIRAVQLGNPDFIYATGLLALIVFAAVLALYDAHTRLEDLR